MEERALIGWQAIATFLGWSYTKAANKRKEWLANGVIFRSAFGKPPHRRHYVCAFPSIIQRWTIIKAKKGELV